MDMSRCSARPAGLLRTPPIRSAGLQLFHYHLVTSKVRLVEARYIGKLSFGLIARYGWVGEHAHWFEAGVSWEELEEMGFRLRLIELGRGAVNVVVQPGQWETPRVDHLGVVLDDEAFADALVRADALRLRIQEHGARRTPCRRCARVCVRGQEHGHAERRVLHRRRRKT